MIHIVWPISDHRLITFDLHRPLILWLTSKIVGQLVDRQGTTGCSSGNQRDWRRVADLKVDMNSKEEHDKCNGSIVRLTYQFYITNSWYDHGLKCWYDNTHLHSFYTTADADCSHTSHQLHVLKQPTGSQNFQLVCILYNYVSCTVHCHIHHSNITTQT